MPTLSVMATDKSVNRGGTYGQEGEISGPRESNEVAAENRRENLDRRDQQKQRGGEGREPDLEKKHHVQPKHVVD